MTTLKIVQHNALKWTYLHKNKLSNLYMRINPGLILLNSTGMKESERIKFFNYDIYQRNIYNEDSVGNVVGVRKDLKHQIMDGFAEDCLAVRIETTKGPVIIGTTYRSLRREDLLIEDMMKLPRKNVPVYILADLNARHRFLGHGDDNDAGRILNNMINQNLAVFVGPDFNTRVRQGGLPRPDIILRNRCAFLNSFIREGDLTTSDHIPIVFIVSTTAIIREATKKKTIQKGQLGSLQKNGRERHHKEKE